MGSCVCLVISQTLNYIPALFLIFRYHSVTQASLELTTHLSEPLGGWVNIARIGVICLHSALVVEPGM